jgi:hypothetical protein
MNPHNALLTLWHATHGPIRWVIAVFCIVMGGLWILVLQGTHGADRDNGIAIFLGLGNVFFWMFFPSRTLPLAIDARQLRLPGIQRGIVVGLLLLGLLTIALPAVAVGLCGGDAGVLAAILSLCAVAGFTLAMVPRYLFTALILLPSLRHSLQPYLDLPGPADPHFIPWAGLTALALFLISILCWRRQLRADNPYAAGFNTPLALQGRFRRSMNQSRRGDMASDDELERMTQTIKRLAWMSPQVDMRRTGPDHPVRSLRLALGGVLAPLSWIGRLQLLVAILVPAFVFALVMTLSNVFGPREDVIQVLQTIGTAFVSWLGAACGVMIAIGTIGRLNYVWRRVNTELPLLALLPGFKNAANVRRTLLVASLLPSLRSEAVLLAVMLGTGIALHCGGFIELFMVLAQLGSAGVIVAFALCIFGGCPLPIWSVTVILAPVWILLGVHSFMPSLSVSEPPWGAGMFVLPVFGLIWLLFALLLFWLARRGWRELRLRPHPFLPN